MGWGKNPMDQDLVLAMPLVRQAKLKDLCELCLEKQHFITLWLLLPNTELQLDTLITR